MKIIRMTETGGPDVLKYIDVPTPKPGPGEVLVKAHAIGVCMPEIYVRQGVYAWMPPLPVTPGIEMSGTVVEAGSGCTQLRVGQKVFVCAREFQERANCYAEYIAAPESQIFAVPEVPGGVDLDQVAGLANYQVAWHLVNSALKGFQYDSVLVIAAAGGVGTALVQLCKAYGKRVIGVVSSPDRAAFARAQGCDEIIDRKQGDVVAQTLKLTNGRGVDLILDCVGGPHMTKLFDALERFGMLLLYGRIDGPATGNIHDAVHKKPWRSAAFRYFSMHTLDDWPELRGKGTHDLLRLLAEGKIKVPIYDRIPLAEAPRAHRVFESGVVMGKLLMKP
jgi:NADPH2:quinone reductase